MTTENFAYWLQGYFEISQSNELTPQQVQEIKNHLALVFEKKTPFFGSLYDYTTAPPATIRLLSEEFDIPPQCGHVKLQETPYPSC